MQVSHSSLMCVVHEQVLASGSGEVSVGDFMTG